MTTAADIRQLLEDRPDLKPALAAVLAAEVAADEPWTFADVA
jgi:hypothetical protein